MTRYSVEISRTAERQLKSIPHADQRRLATAMLALATDPRPHGSRKLSGYEDVFRVRIGRYRILYSVSDTVLIVIVLKIGDRKDVYR
jgi:mRNA interferase RelE/StbE